MDQKSISNKIRINLTVYKDILYLCNIYIYILRISILLFVGAMIVNGTVGKSTGGVSRKYFLKITPPGYFFAVWGVIYSTQFVNNHL